MENKIANRYMIVTPLGEGGMADVYLAIDTILNREVAVKVLRGELSKDPCALLRFQREANAVSKLNHNNIVEVYDVGECEEKHYIVMEYVRGRTLKQLLAQRGALHKNEAVDIMKQLASAVSEANSKNIIHRDLKPQNIMIKDDGTVKITDFGISLAHDVVPLTQTNSILGSAQYLAPEVTNGEIATNQIDIYALGIIFYEILSGDVPFKGENPIQIAMKHTQEEIPSILEFNPTIPQTIDNIIIKATAKNRMHRYKNANEMLKDLNECLDPQYMNVEKIEFIDNDVEKTIVMSDVVKPTIEIERTSNSKIRNIIIAGVVLLVIIAIAVIVYTSGILSNKDITVPDVEGLKVQDAINKLEFEGINVDTKYQYELSDKHEKGTVVSTYPKAGESITEDKPLKIIISSGQYFEVGNYVGKHIDEVQAIFNEHDLNINAIIETKVDKDKKPGEILEQSLLNEGTKIDPSKYVQIKFVIVETPEFVIDPSLEGMDINVAKELLEKKGVKVELKTLDPALASPDDVANAKINTVIKIDPGFNTVFIYSQGKVITIYYYETKPIGETSSEEEEIIPPTEDDTTTGVE